LDHRYACGIAGSLFKPLRSHSGNRPALYVFDTKVARPDKPAAPGADADGTACGAGPPPGLPREKIQGATRASNF